MKTYTIIGGVNGVGKTSFTGALKGRTNDLGIVVDVDKLTAQCGGASLEGGRRAIHIMDNCMENGLSFTQETTLAGHRPKNVVKKAKALGYYIRLFYIGLDTADESKRRIANRVSLGGHNIDSEDVDRRFTNRWMSLSEILPFCDEAVFYDNKNGFVKVAEFRNGELLMEGDYRPDWIMALMKYLQQRG